MRTVPADIPPGGAATGYARLAGKRLALVESMPHEAFYEGIHAAREFGCEIWLLVQDEGRYTDGRPFSEHPLGQVDKVLRVDTHDRAAIVDALTDAHGRPLVDGVTSFSDGHTEAAALAAAHLALPSQGPRAVRTANHKHLLRRALDGDPANVAWRLVTGRDELDDAVRHVGLPLIAKPPSGSLSYGVRKCTTAAEVQAAWRELSHTRRSPRGLNRPGHVLFEEYVRGVEISVESITVAGGTHFFGATSKHLHKDTLLAEAHSFPMPLGSTRWAEVTGCVDRALRTIGYRQGPAHTEVLITEDGPRIVAISPRLPAHVISTMVADTCGTDPHLDAKLLALGLTPSPGRPGDGHRRACAVVALVPDEPGRFIGIGGLREATAHGVQIALHADLGDHVAGRLDNSAPVGFVRAHADAADQALATARRAASLIGITTIGARTSDE